MLNDHETSPQGRRERARAERIKAEHETDKEDEAILVERLDRQLRVLEKGFGPFMAWRLPCIMALLLGLQSWTAPEEPVTVTLLAIDLVASTFAVMYWWVWMKRGWGFRNPYLFYHRDQLRVLVTLILFAICILAIAGYVYWQTADL